MTRISSKILFGGPTELGYIVSDGRLAGPPGLFDIRGYEEAQIDLGLPFQLGVTASADRANRVKAAIRTWTTDFAKSESAQTLAEVRFSQLVLSGPDVDGDVSIAVGAALGLPVTIQKRYLEVLRRHGFHVLATLDPHPDRVGDNARLNQMLYVVGKPGKDLELVGAVMQWTDYALRNFLLELEDSRTRGFMSGEARETTT